MPSYTVKVKWGKKTFDDVVSKKLLHTKKIFNIK
jgi:hypothetical protein